MRRLCAWALFAHPCNTLFPYFANSMHNFCILSIMEMHGHTLHILATPFSPSLRLYAKIFILSSHSLHTLCAFFAHPWGFPCTIFTHFLHTLSYLLQCNGRQLSTSVLEAMGSPRAYSSYRLDKRILYVCAYNNQWGVRKLRPYGLTNWSNV